MEFIKKRIADADRLIRSEIARCNLAGANLLLLKDGKELYRASYGMADIENNIPMAQDTIFRMFSMSKPVTCAAAMMLIERGVIDVYDPVSNYLPAFYGQNVFTKDGLGTVPARRGVLIRDLLNMTSGVAYPDDCTPAGKAVAALFDEMTAAQDRGAGFSTVQLADRLGRIPLAFQPGEHWMYGTSADVLGAVVEIASGMRFGDFLREEIFLPLGMNDTDFYVPAEKKRRFAQLYRCSELPDETAATCKSVVDSLSSLAVYQRNKKMRIAPETGKNLGLEGYDHAPAFESGGAGLVSTIDDYAHFATMLLQGGVYNGKRILGEKTVRFMCSPQLGEAYAPDLNWDSLRGCRYGNLMRHLVDPCGGGTNADAGEFGWDGWAGTYFTIDPKERFIMLYLIQRCDAGCNEITRRLRGIAYSMLQQ